MRVLFASAEFAPLATTGGLGDAVAGIAHAVDRLGVEVTTVMPRYRLLGDIGESGAGRGPARALFRHEVGNVTVLLADDPPAFDRPGIYGPEGGGGYEDDWLRWARFSRVVAALADEFDVTHLHDAHTAAAALLTDAPTVLTLHNAAYPVLGPLAGVREALRYEGPDDSIEWYGGANLLKAGILAADQVTTVSPGYAEQITRDPEVSSGLNEHLAGLRHPVIGIMNGIDTTRFNPATDTALPATYDADDLSPRQDARNELVRRTGITTGFLLGMVGRMSDQKGLGLLDQVIDDLAADDVGLVLVGSGDMDDTVSRWVARHPDRVWHGAFDPELARLVWAGVDAYLMPSRFEPGGLGNLYGMRYGAPPIVRFTGGLANTVIDADRNRAAGNGFGFDAYDAGELLETIHRARKVWETEPERWRQIQDRGMRADWGWDPPARRYLTVYREVLGR